MKKRIFSLLLALCLAVGLLPTVAYAEGGTSHEGWTELTIEVLESCGYRLLNGNYYLGKDISVDTCVNIGNGINAADVTLDLNGYKLKNDTNNISLLYISCSTIGSTATLTLMDSSSAKTGKVISRSGDAVHLESNSKLNANGGTVEGHVILRSNTDVIDNTDSSNVTVFTGTIDNQGGTIKGGIFYGTVSGGTISGNTVTFMKDGSKYALEVVADGKTVVAPEAPTKGDDTFTGWYTDEALTDKYEFGNILSEDITLYAGFEPILTLTVPFTTTVKLGGNTAPGKTTFRLGLFDGTGNKLTYDDQYFFAEITTDGAGDYDGELTITAPLSWLKDILSVSFAQDPPFSAAALPRSGDRLSAPHRAGVLLPEENFGYRRNTPQCRARYCPGIPLRSADQ